MTNDEIRLGQCWMVRLTKCDLYVRLESRNPDGGWTGRAMSHGRKVTIKSATQLLRRCDDVKVYTATPNRRSRAKPPSVKPKTRKSSLKVTEPICKPPTSLSILDVAAIVLRESKTALTTREIIALVVVQKLWQPSGATPWATLNAALNRDIQANGTQSRFKKKERGHFTLR